MGCGCNRQKNKVDIPKTDKPLKLLFKAPKGLSNELILSVAIRNLKLSHGNKFFVDILDGTPSLWDNNPYLTPLSPTDFNVIKINDIYNPMENSLMSFHHISSKYVQLFEDILNIKINNHDFMPNIFLSMEETKNDILDKYDIDPSSPFWIISNGGPSDNSTQWPNPEHMQEVVNTLCDKITFIQIGVEDEDVEDEPGSKNVKNINFPLDNVKNLIGKTTLKEFIRLLYHASGVLTPPSFVMHATAAMQPKNPMIPYKPCVVIAGGKESTNYNSYPVHKYLSSIGTLTCCSNGGCKISTCQILKDSELDGDTAVCYHPEKINTDVDLVIPKCINIIKPKTIIDAITSYYDGGILKYDQ